jgi:hypothetical protein
MSNETKTQSTDVKKPHQEVQDSKGSFTPPGVGQQGANVMATIENDDERLLARLGYRQVLASSSDIQ